MNKKNNIIKLNNRYKVCNRLVQDETNPEKWYLVFANQKEYDYCRVGLKEGEHDWNKNDFLYIDPSGGPFISIGDKFDGMIVYKITLEEINNEKYYILYLK